MHHDAQNNWGKMEFNKYIFHVLTCLGYTYNSVIEHFLSMNMGLGLIFCTIKKKKKATGGGWEKKSFLQGHYPDRSPCFSE